MTNAVAGLILMVVTSHSELAPGDATGLWLEEFAIPYEAFIAEGHQVDVASPKGGEAPVDPRSLQAGGTEGHAPVVPDVLKQTLPLSGVDVSRYDAVFFPGGHGTMFDLPARPEVQAVVDAFLNSGRPAAFVCHGPAALVGARAMDGQPAVKGRKLTAFTDSEEVAVKLDGKVPFLLETRLRELGAEFVGGPDFEAHIVEDGNLITGQNPASSAAAAQALIRLLGAR